MTTTADTASSTGLKPQTYMAVIATVAAIAGGLYGYDTGIISGALPQIANDFQLDYRAQEWVTAAILLGAVIGAICSTRLSASRGRRTTIMIVAAIYCIGVLAAALSPNVWCLAAARLVLGFAVGGSTQIVPTYIAELAPSDKRGRLVTYFNVSIGVGILLAAIVGVAGQNLFDWRWMAEQGIGLWPEERIGGRMEMLQAYGYAPKPGVIAAFQRHFRPEKVNGIADGQTLARLAGLMELVAGNPEEAH